MMSPIWIWQESFQTDISQSFNQLSNQQVPVSSKLIPRVDIKLQKNPLFFSVKQSRTCWVPYLDSWLRRLYKAHFSG